MNVFRAPPTRIVNVRSGARYDVYVGRGSIWGSPFTHLPLEDTAATVQVATRFEAIARYEEWLLGQPFLMARLPELRGKILACYCAPANCHAEVLARYANCG